MYLKFVVAANIVNERIKQGLTQAELARQSSITPAYLCDIEHGRKWPTDTTIEAISKVLGIGAWELYYEYKYNQHYGNN